VRGHATGTATTRTPARVLFVAVAFGTTSFIASVTVVPLVAQDLTRSVSFSGLPWAASVLGTGIGSALISRYMARRGRAPGLIAGFACGAVGAGVALVAMQIGSFVLFVPAVLVMGAGNAANHLSRYAAADIYPADRRASGLGMVVWAGTVGGVVGPAVLDPSGRWAMSLGLPRLGGPFILAVVGCACAVLAVAALYRLRPNALRPHETDDAAASGLRVLDMWRIPRAQIALVALAIAQTVMVMIMAMTPLHIRSTGHGLGAIGFVISSHVFGMYGLSPISGRLADRFGSVAMVLVGFGLLATAAITAASSPHTAAGSWLAVPLFLLGFGWSLTFVAASAMLTSGLSYADRARLQGATDAVVWTAAALAGLMSGLLVDAFGYGLLCVVGALLIVPPLVAVPGRRRVLLSQPS
jgi:MFS family permease